MSEKPIVKFEKLTAFTPDGGVLEFPGDKIAAAGIEPNSGNMFFVVILNDAGTRMQKYYGIPFTIVENQTGLVGLG